MEDAQVVGLNVSDSSEILQFNGQKRGYDAVVLAVGHSARDIYQMLLSHNVDLVPKDFAVSASSSLYLDRSGFFTSIYSFLYSNRK